MSEVVVEGRLASSLKSYTLRAVRGKIKVEVLNSKDGVLGVLDVLTNVKNPKKKKYFIEKFDEEGYIVEECVTYLFENYG